MTSKSDYTFRRIASLSSIFRPASHVLIAGDAYASWGQALRRQQKFVGCVDRDGEAEGGFALAPGTTRFVLLLQRGWSPNILVSHACGVVTRGGDIEEAIAAYQLHAAKDPRKLIAHYFRMGSLIGTFRRRPMIVWILMAIEAAGVVLLPSVRGPFLVWP